ncbi:MAG: hypothetical protein ABJA87_04215 [bacterium]
MTDDISRPSICSVEAALKARHDRRAARTALTRDLATFDTRSDLTDLAAILDRHSDADASGVRAIIDWSRSA